MKQRRPFKNKQEDTMIRSLSNLQLYDQLMPVIRAVALAGGGSEQILKKSEAAAALQLVESLISEKDDVRLKASVEILNRTTGKPVERTLNIYGDISKMNERDVDNQILRAIEKSGAHQLIETAISERALPAKVKQSRKPRKSDPIGKVDPSPEA